MTALLSARFSYVEARREKIDLPVFCDDNVVEWSVSFAEPRESDSNDHAGGEQAPLCRRVYERRGCG